MACNGVGHINKVELRRARLVLGLVITFGGCIIPVFSRPLIRLRNDLYCVELGVKLYSLTHSGHSGPLSLAIPLEVGTMSTGDGFGHHWGRNSEFCVEVGPVSRTAGILAYCILA